MPIFNYKAINDTGGKVRGEIEAGSAELAMDMLWAKGYFPETVRKKTWATLKWSKISMGMIPVKYLELILFTKQLKTLIQSGVAMMDILRTLEAQTENKRLKKVMTLIKEDIREGATLYQAFSKHRDIFSELYCNMILAGEASGSLPVVLERLIYIIEHEHKVKSDIKAALRYPMMVMVVLGMAFLTMLTFVIPRFVAIFQRSGLDLPAPTQICLVLYQAVNEYWMVSLPVLLAGLVAGRYFFFKSRAGQVVKDRFLLRLPLVGPVILKAAMSRFASIFSIFQMSGVSVLDAIEVLSKTINNAAIAPEFEKIRELLNEGKGIAGPLESSKYFPPMVIHMIAIGEEAGDLDNMLAEISSHYDAEVEYATKAMAEAIGPILVVGLAVVVGFFALAIFLPVWDLAQIVR